MAGMLAARVLSDHFDHVTVMERDILPPTPKIRAGVPQARHVHVLLARGQQIIESLFPGITEEFVAAGAELIDTARDFAWLTPAGWGLRFDSGIPVLALSRESIDFVVRRRVAALAQVEFLEDTEAAGLLSDRLRHAVVGVAAWRRTAAEGSNVFADFVVEASGRGSRAPVWLEALGYEKPAESVVNARLGYASRIFRKPAGFDPGWRGMFQQAAPPEHPYAGVVFPIEGGRMMVTLAGGGGEYPPVDEDGFLAFARKLRHPAIAELIRQSEPLSPIAGYRGTENRWRHYEKLRRRPERFVVMGDAACAFNPVYGQGITTSALGAVTLQRCLGALPSGRVAGRFQQELAEEFRGPWTFASGEDVRYRNVEGGAISPPTRFMHWYVDRVLELSTHNLATRRAVLEVFHLLKQPDSLFQPSIAGSVLRQMLLGSPLPQAARQTA